MGDRTFQMADPRARIIIVFVVVFDYADKSIFRVHLEMSTIKNA